MLYQTGPPVGRRAYFESDNRVEVDPVVGCLLHGPFLGPAGQVPPILFPDGHLPVSLADVKGQAESDLGLGREDLQVLRHVLPNRHPHLVLDPDAVVDVHRR